VPLFICYVEKKFNHQFEKKWKKTPNVPKTRKIPKDATTAKAWKAIATFLDAPNLSKLHIFS